MVSLTSICRKTRYIPCAVHMRVASCRTALAPAWIQRAGPRPVSRGHRWWKIVPEDMEEYCPRNISSNSRGQPMVTSRRPYRRRKARPPCLRTIRGRDRSEWKESVKANVEAKKSELFAHPVLLSFLLRRPSSDSPVLPALVSLTAALRLSSQPLLI